MERNPQFLHAGGEQNSYLLESTATCQWLGFVSYWFPSTRQSNHANMMLWPHSAGFSTDCSTSEKTVNLAQVPSGAQKGKVFMYFSF